MIKILFVLFLLIQLSLCIIQISKRQNSGYVFESVCKFRNDIQEFDFTELTSNNYTLDMSWYESVTESHGPANRTFYWNPCGQVEAAPLYYPKGCKSVGHVIPFCLQWLLSRSDIPVFYVPYALSNMMWLIEGSNASMLFISTNTNVTVSFWCNQEAIGHGFIRLSKITNGGTKYFFIWETAVACDQPKSYTPPPPAPTPKVIPPEEWVLVGVMIMGIMVVIALFILIGFIFIKKFKIYREVNNTHYTSLWLVDDNDATQKVPLMKLDNLLDDEYDEDTTTKEDDTKPKTNENDNKLVATIVYEEDTSY